MTLNEVRSHLGLEPYTNPAADRPMVLTATGYVPIEANAASGGKGGGTQLNDETSEDARRGSEHGDAQSAAVVQKYNPDQPRVPAGNPDGGQWTEAGAVASYRDPQILSDAPDPTWAPGAHSAQGPRGRGWSSGPVRINGQFHEPTPGQAVRLTIAEFRWNDAMSRVQRIDPNWKPRPGIESTVEGLIRNLERETQEAEDRIAESFRPNVPSPRGGHHWVPRAVFREFGLPPETMEVFEKSASGTLENNIVNRWGPPHAEYNKAVEEALEGFLARNAIAARQMTPEHARRFLEIVLKSHDPRIRDFNLKVMEQRLRYLSSGGQDTDNYDD